MICQFSACVDCELLERHAHPASPTSCASSIRTKSKAPAQLHEALAFWGELADGDPLNLHLRAADIQAFEFSYELSVRTARPVLL